MIDARRILNRLHDLYPDVELVSDGLYRIVQRKDGKRYAVKYFDLRDDIRPGSDLREYQDRLLGPSYFSKETPTDLRWNHYLYFVTSTETRSRPGFDLARRAIESNREYARKQVIDEEEVERVLQSTVPTAQEGTIDSKSIVDRWEAALRIKQLDFAIDQKLPIAKAVRHVVEGTIPARKPDPASIAPDVAEAAVSHEFVRTLTIRGFRRFPLRREFRFGNVNLILGVNGVGKTCLLESIEFMFCGQTKRNRRTPPSTTVAGGLAKSGLVIATSSKTTKKQLRARHLLWYGKNELKTLSIDESFGKFNFLNTDAAVRLTLEQSEAQIGRDVAQLILGAHTGRTLDRLRRIEAELEDLQRISSKELSLRRTQLQDTQRRLQNLEGAPRYSDELYTQFLDALEKVGWTPISAKKAKAPDLRQQLQDAMTNARVLMQAAVSNRTLNGIEDRVSKQRHQLTNLQALAKRDAENRAKRATVDRRLQPLISRLSGLDELIPFASASVDELVQRRNVISKALATVKPSVAAVPLLGGHKIAPDMLKRRLDIACRNSVSTLSEQDEKLRLARMELDRFEQSQSGIESLKQQLRSVASRILEQSLKKDKCPLCHAEYQRGGLETHISEDLDEAIESRSRELRQAVEAARLVAQDAEHVSNFYEAVRQFVGRSEARSLTVESALDTLAAARKQVELNSRELGQLDSALSELDSAGLSETRLKELKSQASIKGKLPSYDRLMELRGGVAGVLDKQAEEHKLCDAEERSVKKAARAIATRNNWDADLEIDELLKRINREVIEAEAASRALSNLRQVVELRTLAEPIELGSRLEQAHSLLLQLSTALKQESAAETELAVVRNTYDQQGKEIDAKSLEHSRVKGALITIGEILGGYSEGQLTAQLLSENSTEIARIFSSIHTPNEFDLTTSNQGLGIRRRETDERVDLSEMSTGQRAAFALSLFLAMNARLKSGPRVVLFDDPVAHVDDLNILSFLDYLRDLVLAGERQIFFATANEKLAGLFRHKFAFLGEESFKEIQLSRS
jgi:DNA repair protein SbcC/Rad50